MNTSILVVAAHPDDEVLGCGGAIARFSSEGCDVHVLILADGETSRNGQSQVHDVSARQVNSRMACEILGCKTVEFLTFPDNKMDVVPRLEIVKCIEDAICRLQPKTIITHTSSDVNIDHRIVHDSVIVACRPQPDFSVTNLLFFEIPSSTEWRPPGSSSGFHPNWFIDISPFLEKKLNALMVYEKELRQFPHSRSIEAVSALAKWRGASVGLAAAEAFVLGRQIVRTNVSS